MSTLAVNTYESSQLRSAVGLSGDWSRCSNLYANITVRVQEQFVADILDGRDPPVVDGRILDHGITQCLLGLSRAAMQ